MGKEINAQGNQRTITRKSTHMQQQAAISAAHTPCRDFAASCCIIQHDTRCRRTTCHHAHKTSKHHAVWPSMQLALESIPGGCPALPPALMSHWSVTA